MKTISGTFGPKPAFEVASHAVDADGTNRLVYYAGFWNGRSYDRVKCHDSAAPGGKWRNTAQTVSYYSQMPKVRNA